MHKRKQNFWQTFTKKDKEKGSFFDLAEKFFTSEMCKNNFQTQKLKKHHNTLIYLYNVKCSVAHMEEKVQCKAGK